LEAIVSYAVFGRERGIGGQHVCVRSINDADETKVFVTKLRPHWDSSGSSAGKRGMAQTKKKPALKQNTKSHNMKISKVCSQKKEERTLNRKDVWQNRTPLAAVSLEGKEESL
jgi:hypothetical protein